MGSLRIESQLLQRLGRSLALPGDGLILLRRCFAGITAACNASKLLAGGCARSWPLESDPHVHA